MKRYLALPLLLLMLPLAAAAQEVLLLDFSLLIADTYTPGLNEGPPDQNYQTMVVLPLADDAPSSLAIQNWGIQFTGVAQSWETYMLARSEIRESPSRQWGTVLGARIHFHRDLPRIRNTATIHPPFAIPLEDSRFENGYGLFRDPRGVRLRAIIVSTYGLQNPISLSITLRLDEHEQRIIFLGDLSHDGWRDLRWNNPNILEETQDNIFYNSIRIENFIINNDYHRTGDTIIYLRDVRLILDYRGN